MPLHIPHRWAVLEIGSAGLAADVVIRDSRGQEKRVALPHVGELLAQLAADLPEGRSGPHSTGVVPLAVFVSPPANMPGALWENEITRVLAAQIDVNKIQVVRLLRRRWVRRPRFELPFRLLASGAFAEATLTPLMQSHWLQQSGFAGEFGLTFESAPRHMLADRLNSEIRDIVIIDDLDEHTLDLLTTFPLDKRPRLVISLQPIFAERLDTVNSIEGVSYLSLVSHAIEHAGWFIRDLIYGLIHDLPLHEALKASLRTQHFDPVVALLLSDPEANHDLRIMDALTTLRERGLALEAELGWIPVIAEESATEQHSFGAIFTQQQVPPSQEFQTHTFEPAMQPSHLNLTGAIKIARYAHADFSREEQGLVPLAAAGAALSSIQPQVQRLRDYLGYLAANQDLVTDLRERQNRRVDVGVERINAYELPADVGTHSSLAGHRRYRVRVHIGNQLPGSVVLGEPPPITPLLPDDQRGHELEVGVQAKDFTLLSPPLATLYLPFAGGTAPVYFIVRTPAELGAARLRIAIYHKNHLLQSFLMKARITTEEESLAPETGIEAHLEYSRSDRFTNLDALRPRSLSIGANLTQNTHEISVKSDGIKEEVSLPPLTFDSHMAAFRSLLLELTFAASGTTKPRDFPSVTPGQPVPQALGDFIRRLARKGNDLYNALFARSAKGLQYKLADLKKKRDEIIQVVRFDPTFAFPWALLYDFDLPATDAKPVCLGWTGSAPCGHSPDDDVYCVNGFLGIRHIIEELMGLGHGDAHFVVERSSKANAVRIAANARLVAANELTAKLQERIGAAEVAVGPVDDARLIDLLWTKQPERPSILIIFGHLETRPPIHTSEPNDPRIVLVNGSKWLTERGLAKRFQREIEPWQQPRTIVLLMACESAAVGAETINSFVETLHRAGALAIVGTECIVFSQLVSQFAEEITVALWAERTPLGEALINIRRRLMYNGNPLAFVFHCIGSADLTLVCKN